MSEIVQSIDRALSILEVLSDYNEGLGVTEISKIVNLHKSTVYRLLNTLIYKGYVVKDIETNQYKTTLKLFILGNKKVKDMDLLDISKKYINSLMESVNEVVHLVTREENEIVYIAKVEANNTIRMVSRIGTRSPMYSTSSGKAILAYLPEKEVKKIWKGSKIKKLTENTITDYADLRKDLIKIRKNGYAVDNEENEVGVRCVGAPILNMFGEVEGAISISGPAIRVVEGKIEELAVEVVKYARNISKELGYKS